MRFTLSPTKSVEYRPLLRRINELHFFIVLGSLVMGLSLSLFALAMSPISVVTGGH